MKSNKVDLKSKNAALATDQQQRLCDCEDAAKIAGGAFLLGKFYPTKSTDGLCDYCGYVAIKEVLFSYDHASNKKPESILQSTKKVVPKIQQVRRTLIVTNIETGVVQTFGGIKPAIKALHISQKSIYTCLRTGEVFKGYKFEEILK